MRSPAVHQEPEFSPLSDAVYRMRDDLEIHPLDTAHVGRTFVVRTPEDRSFMISEPLRRMLLLFGKGRSSREVAGALQRESRRPVSADQVQQAAEAHLEKHGLIERLDGESPLVLPKKRKRSLFSFFIRIPLVQPRHAEPIVKRLTWLFERPVVWCGLALICLVHLAFYLDWARPHPTVAFTSFEYALLYAIALGTVLIHEFGHAAASHRFSCRHGVIGFTFYLIFPALYVDLSPAWRLPRKQRAVIDAGGVYFQLLATLPFFLIYWTTGSALFGSALFAVDSMVLFALNPIFKFDGYWLMVDLSGLVNLHRRVNRVVKECALWVVGAADGIPSLEAVSSRGKKAFLLVYAFCSALFMTAFMLLLVMFAPRQLQWVASTIWDLFTGAHGTGEIFSTVLRLAGRLIFLLIVARLLSKLLRPWLAKLKGERA